MSTVVNRTSGDRIRRMLASVLVFSAVVVSAHPASAYEYQTGPVGAENTSV